MFYVEELLFQLIVKYKKFENFSKIMEFLDARNQVRHESVLWIGYIRSAGRNDEILPYATRIEAIKNNVEGRQYYF
jgi:hypothetical protein